MNNIFDLVAVPSPQKESSSNPGVRRVCTYKSRFGSPCDRDAEPNSLVCDAHGGKKITLLQLRRDAINLGPLVLERLEEIMHSDNEIAAVAATKLWTELAGVKDIPPVGAGIEEEELDAARRSLSNKLESVVTHLLQRKSA